jgi:hypothetical protein
LDGRYKHACQLDGRAADPADGADVANARRDVGFRGTTDMAAWVARTGKSRQMSVKPLL